MKYLRMLFETVMWWFAHLLVFLGFTLIAYDVLTSSFGLPAVELRGPWLTFVMAISTFLGTFSLAFVSISIYFEHLRRTPPTRVSLRFTAPAMVLLAVGMFFYGYSQNGLSAIAIDGLGSIALGGAIMRMKGVPEGIRGHPS